MLNTYIGWKAQVLHDLHESVPYLYDNTVGDGPYNAWLDPILTDEWQMIGWNNVSEMTKFGMPGVFTHGTFDTWSPGYLMFIAATHNGISRLYETFGNGGADTVERTLRPERHARTWYKQNPPLPQGEVVAAQQQQLRADRPARRRSTTSPTTSKLFLKNFYSKSKRSILTSRRPKGRRPTCFPATIRGPGAQAELLRVLQKQGVRDLARDRAVHRHRARRRSAARPITTRPARPRPRPAPRGSSRPPAGARAERAKPEPETRTFPAGCYIVRMDQPYSRIADALLDYQYWAPERSAEDAVRRHRLDVPRARSTCRPCASPTSRCSTRRWRRSRASVPAPGGVDRHRLGLRRQPQRRHALVTLRYRFKDAKFEPPKSRSRPAGQKFNRGSFIIRNVGAGRPRQGGDRARPQGRRGGRRAVGEDASGARARASR